MNLNMIRSKNETEDLLLSISKNCETLIDQTHRKPEETLEFNLFKPKETFHFRPPIQTQGSWMIRLTCLEVYKSIFIIPERNNKVELYRDSSNKFGFLEDELIRPRNIDEFLKLSHEKKNSDGYIIFLLGYTRSAFRDFESY